MRGETDTRLCRPTRAHSALLMPPAQSVHSLGGSHGWCCGTASSQQSINTFCQGPCGMLIPVLGGNPYPASCPPPLMQPLWLHPVLNGSCWGRGVIYPSYWRVASVEGADLRSSLSTAFEQAACYT